MRKWTGWKQLAMRDGAITLYNFHECLQAINGLVGKVPSLSPHMDRAAAKDANKTFAAAFPEFADIRLSVAHSGALLRAEEEASKHTIPGTKRTASQIGVGNSLVSSINKGMASYDLSADSLQALEEIANAMFRAFRPVAEFTQALSTHRGNLA